MFSVGAIIVLSGGANIEFPALGFFAPATQTTPAPVVPTSTASPSSTPISTMTSAPTITPLPSSTPTSRVAIQPSLTGVMQCIPPSSYFDIGEVIEVISGNVIVVDMDGEHYQVRYVGIETPDLSQPGGQEAFIQNAGVVEGKTVYLFEDVSDSDSAGNLLRYVMVDGDEVFVNYELLVEGYAAIDIIPPDVACAATFSLAEREAKGQAIGLWEATPTPGRARATAIPLVQVTPTFSFLSWTTSVQAGSSANVTIQTATGASCFLSYTSPSGRVFQGEELGVKIADHDGRCSWS
jgi:endonuclease YncB( thermonuclease family)